MSPRLLKIAKWVGYPLFYLTCLVLFAKATFPYHRVKSALVGAFNAEQPAGSGMRLEVDDMSSYWLTGVEAEGIRLTERAPGNPNDAATVATPPKVTNIDSLYVTPSVWSLLSGTVAVAFGGSAFGGELSGQYQHGETRRLDLKFEGLSLAELPLIQDILGLPLTGNLSGAVDLSLPEGKLAKADGSVELHVDALVVGDGKAKIRDAIALPALNAGELVLKAQSVSGRLKIEQLSVKGTDLELLADGKANFRDPLTRTTLNLDARFKFADSYKNKDDMTRSIFGAPNSQVPGLLDLDPKMKSAKQPDGFYGWRVSGPLAKPTFLPGPGSGSAAANQ